MSAKYDHRQLLRYLHGELPPAASRQLQAALARDPELAARLEALRGAWQRLQPPPAVPPQVGTAARLTRAAWEAHRQPRGLRLGPTPPWARPLVGAALAAGVALGVWLGQPTPVGPRGGAVVAPAPAGSPPAAAPAAGVASAPAGASEPSAPPATAGSTAPGAHAAAPPGGAATAATEVEPLAADEPSAEDAAEWDGEVTLAEAYLQAVEGGEVSGW